MNFSIDSAFISLLFFFFQAEDGIRDIGVTGVQTCALPISGRRAIGLPNSRRRATRAGNRLARLRLFGKPIARRPGHATSAVPPRVAVPGATQNGKGAGGGRGEISGGAGFFKKKKKKVWMIE